ncbi:MAG: hypothetical protein QOG79_4365, partial [Mycobacterium sp.]|nr:hypothetical protein [Mycobacterium sp.]
AIGSGDRASTGHDRVRAIRSGRSTGTGNVCSRAVGSGDRASTWHDRVRTIGSGRRASTWHDRVRAIRSGRRATTGDGGADRAIGVEAAWRGVSCGKRRRRDSRDRGTSKENRFEGDLFQCHAF